MNLIEVMDASESRYFVLRDVTVMLVKFYECHANAFRKVRSVVVVSELLLA